MYLQKLPNFVANCERSSLIAFFWGRYVDGHAKFSPAGYRKFFPLRKTMSARRRLVGKAITSDCDPFNFYCSTAMRRIESLINDPKFIVSLRNPIDRSYSDYQMAVRAGETRSFEDFIDAELTGSETRFRRRFLNQSVYEPHLRRWIERFGEERFMIIHAEEFFRDPAKTTTQMFSFLGLPGAQVDLSPKNVGRYTEVINPETRKKLKDYFEPYNQRLYELIRRDFGWQ